MENVEGFDQTKENIQPLTQGRIPSQFGAALNAQTNAEVHQEQRKILENFELQLRTYEGDDPLSSWYDYILWLEQSFPKGGKEGNIQIVLDKCLAKFKDVSQYMQDTRYIKLWIKYIDICVDVSRTELYQIAYNHGVGTQSALFYRFWAYEYEKCRDFKMAEQIYEKGIACNAQPAEELLKAQTNFMKTITRMTLHGDVPSPQRPDMGMPDHRQVLNALRPHGHNSHLVRNVRVGSNILRSEPKAPLVASNTNSGPQAKLRIFSDDNDSAMELNVGPNQMHTLPRPTVMNKENSLKAGPWSGPAGRRKPKPLPASFVPDRPTFLVHSDETAPESRGAQPACSVANALKPIKRDVVATPCYVAEPYDPTKRPMYPKHLVYDGGVEFSLEELRAARYLKMERERGARLGSRVKQPNIPFVMEVTDDLPVDLINVARKNTEDHAAVPVKKMKTEWQMFDTPIVGKQPTSTTGMYCDNDRRMPSLIKEANEHPQNTNKPSTNWTASRVPSTNYIIPRVSSINGMAPRVPSTNETASPVPSTNNIIPRVSSANGMAPCVPSTNEMASRVPSTNWTASRVQLTNETSSCVPSTNETTSRVPSTTWTASRVPLTNETASRVSSTNDTTPCVPSTNEMAPSQRRRTMYVAPSFPSKVTFESIPKQIHFERSFADHPEQHQQHSSCNESNNSSEALMAHCQSFTVNTKEAMSEMYELWGSKQTPAHRKVSPEAVGLPTITVSHASTVGSSPAEPQDFSSNKFSPFDIFTDDAEPAANNEDHKTTTTPFQVYSDEGFSDNLFSGVITQDTQAQSVASTNFQIYEEDVEQPEFRMPSSIPIVPSPGMSPSEIRALEGTDLKENRVPVYYEMPEEDERELAGILQPSTTIPFVPLSEQIPEEPEANNVTCVTQAFTQAFRFPLMSSTPFHGNMPPPTDESEYTPRYSQTNSNDGGAEAAIALKSQEPVAPQTTDSQGPINLSIIMEDSKELNYKSSSSSGSSNATTRRTFSHAQWSSTASYVPEYTNKSEFRNKDSLAAIKENESIKNAESDVESRPSLEESPISQLKTQMKAEVFLMDIFQSPVVCSEEKRRVVAEGKVSHCDDIFTAEEFEIENVSINVFKSPRHEETKLVSRIRDIKLKNVSCHDSSFASAEIDHYSVRHRKESIPQLRANPASLIFDEEATHFSSEYISKNTLLETELHELSAQLYRSNISSYNQSEPCQEVDNNDPNCSKLFSTKDTSKIQDLSSLKSGNTSVASPYIYPNQNDLDPFDVTLIVKLLDRLNYPGKMEKRYLEVEQKLPTFKPGSKVEIANESWQVLNILGKGAYAKVYKVSITEGETTCQKALKVQKPSWVWELYISTEIHRRLQDVSLDSAFMDITKCYGFGNGSVMASDFLQHGTLLHAANKLRSQTKLFSLVQPLSMFWTIEMLRIMEQLHACQIIHGDVKPDNFLLLSLPSSDMSKPSLQLIDFGRSIDLSLFPRGTTFNRVVSTEDFTCVEMQTGRPWTYQTDLYGLASSVHCILFGEYMKVTCVDGKWRLQKRFSRNHMVELWDHFFTEMLNIESCSKMPDLANIRRQFEEAFRKIIDSRILNTFSNIMLGH